jgi:hypothetical protein
MHKSKPKNIQLMKKYTTLALIGAVVASVGGLISIGATSTSLVSMQGTDFHEFGFMIGHVTYEVRGADGQIKHYAQGDNVITRIGTNCAAAAIFDTTNGVCTNPIGNFRYIAIGNGTERIPLATHTGLNNTGLNTGEIAPRILATTSIAPNTGAGTVVTVSTPTGTPFSFTGLGPLGTTVSQSGLFDALTGGNVFAIKELPLTSGSPIGIPVLPSDTLAVTWTITLSA